MHKLALQTQLVRATGKKRGRRERPHHLRPLCGNDSEVIGKSGEGGQGVRASKQQTPEKKPEAVGIHLALEQNQLDPVVLRRRKQVLERRVQLSNQLGVGLEVKEKTEAETR